MSRFALLSTLAAIPLFATAAAAQITFDEWREVVFSPAEFADLEFSGPLADSDGDGASVLQEFFFAGDPILSDSFILPRFGLVADHLTLTFRERHDITGVDIRLQGSGTLAHWVTYNALTEADREIFTGFDEVTLIDPVAMAAPPSRRFIRLRLSLDDPQILRAPERVSISVQSPHVWTVGWTDPNAFETGHAVERLRGLQTWERVGTTGLDQIAWTHTLANYAESFTYRVLAQGEGGTEVASEPYSLPDTDGDGIPDALELGSSYTGEPGTYATDPDAFSSNGSDVADGWLVANGFDPLSFDPNADWDGDGIADGLEFFAQTDPRKPHPGWVNIALPDTLFPVAGSTSGVAVLSDGTHYWRWHLGSLTQLAEYFQNEDITPNLRRNTSVGLNDRGDIAILTTDSEYSDHGNLPYDSPNQVIQAQVTVFPIEGAQWTYVPSPAVVAYSEHSEYPVIENDQFVRWPRSEITSNEVEAINLDSSGNLWVQKTARAFTTFYETGQTGPLGQPLPDQRQDQYRHDLVRITPAGAEAVKRSNVGFLAGIDNTGNGYGWAYTAPDAENVEYFRGSDELPILPLSINEDGDVVGYNYVLRSNGEMSPIPSSSYGYRWDGAERISGQEFNYATWEMDHFLLTQTAADGGWRTVPHERLPMPAEWTTSHLVAVGSTAGQVGYFSSPEVESQPFVAIANPAKLLVDANHDGIIEADPTWENDLTTPTRPLWLHINDNDDNPGEETQADYLNSVVDGPDDLDDFIPVVLDIKQLLAVLPPGALVKYRLKQADGAFNFVYTSLTQATAFDYQDAAMATTGYGPDQDKAAHEAPTHRITATGIDIFELAPDLVTRIKDNDQGVILIELRGMTVAPLKLVVEKDSVQVAEAAVNIATGEIEWESLYENNPVEDFKIPAHYADYTVKDLKWLEGLRYFSDGDGQSATSYRKRINVKVRIAGAAGKSVKLKAFDADDPTPADPTPDDWDPDNIIDPNDTDGPAGDDNNYGLDALTGTYNPIFGTFYGPTNPVYLNTINVVLDGSGEALVGFNLSTKPGANYRIAAVLNENASQLDALQVSHASAIRYVSPDSKPVRGFAGIISSTLTVWRKLHVEVDAMEARPTNWFDRSATVISHEIDTPIPDEVRMHTDSTLPGAEHAFIGGIAKTGSSEFYITGSNNNTIDAIPPGLYYTTGAYDLSSLNGSAVTIRDDDEMHLDALGIVKNYAAMDMGPLFQGLKSEYAPAYIEIIDSNASGMNTRPTLPFSLNANNPGGILPTVFNNAQDLVCTEYFWSHTVVFGYQPSESTDSDPNGESANYGLTGATVTLVSRGVSAIYPETIRDGVLQNSTLIGAFLYNPTLYDTVEYREAAKSKYYATLFGVVAHEIGHGCGGQLDDHYEMGLMRAGLSRIDEHDFSALTINRFRLIKLWR